MRHQGTGARAPGRRAGSRSTPKALREGWPSNPSSGVISSPAGLGARSASAASAVQRHQHGAQVSPPGNGEGALMSSTHPLHHGRAAGELPSAGGRSAVKRRLAAQWAAPAVHRGGSPPVPSTDRGTTRPPAGRFGQVLVAELASRGTTPDVAGREHGSSWLQRRGKSSPARATSNVVVCRPGSAGSGVPASRARWLRLAAGGDGAFVGSCGEIGQLVRPRTHLPFTPIDHRPGRHRHAAFALYPTSTPAWRAIARSHPDIGDHQRAGIRDKIAPKAWRRAASTSWLQPRRCPPVRRRRPGRSRGFRVLLVFLATRLPAPATR